MHKTKYKLTSSDLDHLAEQVNRSAAAVKVDRRALAALFIDRQRFANRLSSLGENLEQESEHDAV